MNVVDLHALNIHPALAPLASILSISSAIAAILPDLEITARICAAIVAVVAGLFTICYYYLAIKEKRLAIQEKHLTLQKIKSQSTTDEPAK